MKRWQSFLVCLLVSASIWLIHNLSRTQTSLVSVPVVAQSSIAGHAENSSDFVDLTARCRASGFRLLYLGWRKDPLKIRFDAEDLQPVEGDYYSISAAQLYRYVPDIFGADVSVESFLFESVQFRFIPEHYRRVPVVPVNLLSFRPQYMQTGEISISPDSVLVYGSSEMLRSISAAYTKPIVKNDIRGNMHGEIALEVPEGTRLSASNVSWEVPVSRYVELTATLPVVPKNVPNGVDLTVYPSSVDVRFRCVFPLMANPLESAGCYVDYTEFAGSVTGSCIIRCTDIPQGVIDVSISPQVAECVEVITQ